MDFVAWVKSAAPRGRTILLDIDGTLVPASASAVEARVLRAVESLKERNAVYLFSNKNLPERNSKIAVLLGVPLVDSPFSKPNPKVLAELPKGMLIVGDKWLTDGLLAWRSGEEFVRVERLSEPGEPLLDQLFNAVDDVAGMMWHLARALRPRQWIKNALVFAPLFFAHDLFEPYAVQDAAAAFAAFCFVSSAAYLINDLRDVAVDRLHPRKRYRPLAHGDISSASAWLMCVGLLAAAWAVLAAWAPQAIVVLAAYFISSVAYSVYLKHVPLLEMLLFIWFYFARMLAGAAAAAVPLSSWFTLSVVFLALFLVVAKRYAELEEGRMRPALAAYPRVFLQAMLGVSAALVVAFYALYTVLGTASPVAVYSTIPVLAGVMRYLQLSFANRGTETPERLVFSDPGLIAVAAAWLLAMVAVFY